VTKKNDVLTALQDVTFAVREREFVAIVGPSGCGKSTALNIIAGLTTLTSGRPSFRVSRRAKPSSTSATCSSKTRSYRGCA